MRKGTIVSFHFTLDNRIYLHPKPENTRQLLARTARNALHPVVTLQGTSGPKSKKWLVSGALTVPDGVAVVSTPSVWGSVRSWMQEAAKESRLAIAYTDSCEIN